MPLDLTNPARVAVDHVPADKVKTLVGMAAHGRPLNSIATALRLPLPVVTTIAIEHGHPHLGMLRKASLQLNDPEHVAREARRAIANPDADVDPGDRETPPAPETALSDGAPAPAGAGEGVPAPDLAGTPSAPTEADAEDPAAVPSPDAAEAERIGALLDDLDAAGSDEPNGGPARGPVSFDESTEFARVQMFEWHHPVPSEILAAAYATGDQQLTDDAGRIVELLAQLHTDTLRHRERSSRLVQLQAELAEARDRVAALEAELDGLNPSPPTTTATPPPRPKRGRGPASSADASTRRSGTTNGSARRPAAKRISGEG